MDQNQIDGHINAAKAAIRLSHGQDLRAYNALAQQLCVAFQSAAPDHTEVKQLARRLMRENFDPENQGKTSADVAGQQQQDQAQTDRRAGRVQPLPGQGQTGGQQASQQTGQQAGQPNTPSQQQQDAAKAAASEQARQAGR